MIDTSSRLWVVTAAVMSVACGRSELPGEELAAASSTGADGGPPAEVAVVAQEIAGGWSFGPMGSNGWGGQQPYGSLEIFPNGRYVAMWGYGCIVDSDDGTLSDGALTGTSWFRDVNQDPVTVTRLKATPFLGWLAVEVTLPDRSRFTQLWTRAR